MEEKIRQYVNYQFRFDKREDIEELKEEIIGNLVDRYHAYVHEGKTEEEAYIEAIKTMGDFTEKIIDDIPEEYSIKPSIPDILLMSGAILSIFGLLITFFSGVTGAIITAISILLFSGSAYYLYSYSQYVRKQYMDIEKHNLLLKKIFKYMKTSFIFWTFGLSVIMSRLVMGIITNLLILSAEPLDGDFIRGYILAYIILFIIALIIFLFIFSGIYTRLMNHYYYLTGTTSLKSHIRDSYEFLAKKPKMPRKSLLLDKKFFPILGMMMIFIQIILPLSYTIESYENLPGDGITLFTINSEGIYFTFLLELLFSKFVVVVVLPIIALILNIIFIVMAFKQKIKDVVLILGYYFWLISSIGVYTLVVFIYPEEIHITGFIDFYALIMIIGLTALLIIRTIRKKQIAKENA